MSNHNGNVTQLTNATIPSYLSKKTFKNYFYTGRYVSVLSPNKWSTFVTKQAFVYLGFTIFVSKDKGLFSLINSFLAFGIGEV